MASFKYKDAENYRLSRDFPALDKYPLTRTSEATRDYNCFAYVAGDTKRQWACLPILPRGVYWPPGIERKENDVWSVIFAYKTLGYDLCDDGKLEANVEKIAIYVDAEDRPLHAAIQRENGEWQSKLGRDIDVSHSLESLEGGLYGKAKYFMSRSRK
ncbi:MAG: hypothetical protein FWD53_06840 [Phycisphaerales bacterium]|nr:hypothetical protein [Phycisphaerales bacterium]